MLSSITPLGERAKNNSWTFTATAYTIGSAVGGAALGVALAPFAWLVSGWSTTTVLVTLSILLVASAVLDSLGAPRPTLPRQVDENWLTAYRGWVYGAGFGLQLGFGLVTIITSWSMWAVVAAAVLGGSRLPSPVAGSVLIGLVFGTTRGLVLLTARNADSPDRLVALHRADSARSQTHIATDRCHTCHSRRTRVVRRRNHRRNHMSHRIEAHGLSVNVPTGWDGAITRSLAVSASADQADGGSVNPVMHVSTIPLPSVRGDFGGDMLAAMGADDLFIALVEYDRASGASPLFDHLGVRRITGNTFAHEEMHRPLPGQSGHQQFFHQADRAFCLYIAIGSHRRRDRLAKAAESVTSTIKVSTNG